MSMTTTEAMERGLDLLGRAEAVYFTTVDGSGRPQTRAMLNLRNKVQFPGLTEFFAEQGPGFTSYFSTNTSSNKMIQIRANPAASLYYCLPLEFIGLMLGGDIQIVGDSAVKKALWQKNWERYYPGGADDPDYTVLRFVPSEAKLYHQLQFAKLL